MMHRPEFVLICVVMVAFVAPTFSVQGNLQCGMKSFGHTRIVGGIYAKPGDWPWQVQIDYLKNEGRFWCGGTLLNTEWVLTAAHCVEDGNKTDYKIYLGEHDTEVSSPHEQKFDVKQMITHPLYNNSTYDYDIALLQIKTKAKINSYVKPACFPDDSITFSQGEECFVTGWGKTVEGGNFSNILQQVKKPLVSTVECKKNLSTLAVVTPRMFCAGYKAGGYDSCHGDSGGPLVCKKTKTMANGVKREQWYVWGVVSWGIGCARADYYGVYASVNKMSPWIRSIVSNLLNKTFKI